MVRQWLYRRGLGNVGESMIVGFGAYAGGHLGVEGSAQGGAMEHDVKRRFVRFNGAGRRGRRAILLCQFLTM